MFRPSWLLRTPSLWRLPRLTKLPLGAEIALILVVKIALLTLLAKTFFSEPQARKMRMPTAQVEQHLLAPAPESVSAATVSNASTSTTEVPHASH